MKQTPRELSLQYSPHGDTYCVEENDVWRVYYL